MPLLEQWLLCRKTSSSGAFLGAIHWTWSCFLGCWISWRLIWPGIEASIRMFEPKDAMIWGWSNSWTLTADLISNTTLNHAIYSNKSMWSYFKLDRLYMHINIKHQIMWITYVGFSWLSMLKIPLFRLKLIGPFRVLSIWPSTWTLVIPPIELPHRMSTLTSGKWWNHWIFLDPSIDPSASF